jgi:hypothetical protein
MTNENPSNLTRTQKMAVLAGAISGFIFVYFSDWILYFFIPIGPALALISAVFRVLGHVILAVSFTFAISMYIKHARSTGLTKKKVIIITVWLLWPAVMITLNYKTYSSFKEAYQDMETTFSDTDRALAHKMNTTPPGEKKSIMTYLHAQSIYRHEGRITEYESPAGEAISYVPDKEDREVSRSVTFMRAHNNSLNADVISSCIVYLMSFLGMIYLGLASNTEPREM